MNRILAYVFIAVTALGGMAASGPTVSPDVSEAQQRSAAASIGISFPPETQFLLYHRDSEEWSLLPSPDDTVHLKIELPPAIAAKFLAARPFSEAQWDANTKVVHDKPDWSEWKPSKVKKSRSAQIELPKGQVLNVLVDEDSPPKTIVYLMWFET